MEEKTTVKRIALLGAESTGKTTLARSLALRFQTLWVPEYARDYVNLNPGPVSQESIEYIAKEQLTQENRAAVRANQFLFCDTEFIVAKVWCIDVHSSCPVWIESQIHEHKYDLYLLTSNDLPWVADPARVNAQRRDYFFNWYKRELTEYNLPFEIIYGRYEQRLLNAIRALEKHFGKQD
jgi:NadR type nicotinamide-nucleotide adenylyltransferase